MSQHFTRKKPKPFLLRFFYLLNRFIPLSKKVKLDLYLDLEWIFARLAHETAIKYFSDKEKIDPASFAFLSEKIKTNDAVLDIGCNLGEISFLLSKKAKNVIGIDYNQNAIEIAKSKHQANNLQFLNTEAFAYLKSNQQQFNVLILSHVLEHLDNPQDFLLKCKNNFQFIYIEVPDVEATILNRYRIRLDTNYRYTDDDHLVEFDRKDLNKLITDCGIQILEAEYRYGVQKLWCSVNSIL